MEKLTMSSKDLAQENIEKMGRLFPNVITEVKDENGNITRAIDFELLQQELNDEIVEGEKERYQLTWPGKKEAILMANTPINKTLRPVKEDSLNWEDTENLYIEGDNLEVLKLLQESYLSKVKCIYIDPPYNTGKDFIYRDKFTQDKDEYLEESGQVDEEGNRLFQNTEYNGRYHSDWLTMMYPRLKLARNLLAEDGVIFISIDDNEVHNLRKICDEVFGERNYVETLYLQVRYDNKSLTEKDDFQKLIEQVLIYKKEEFYPVKPYEEYSLEKFCFEVIEKGQGKKEVVGHKNVTIFEEDEYEIREIPPNIDGLKETWASGTVLKGNASGKYFDKYLSNRTSIDGYKILYKVEGIGEDGLGFRYFVGPREERYTKGKFYSGVPLVRRKEIQIGESRKYRPITTFYNYAADFGNISHEGGIAFRSGKKPTKLVNNLISMVEGGDFIVLDFFSGSASTAHAVMQKNSEDGGNRKFIMVQLPELTEENSDYRQLGFENIAQLGKERIRRAGEKIKEETGAGIDYGFRVFKVDSTNMKNVYYRPDELEQTLLDELNSNMKEDRTSLDLLTQIMLEMGLELSLPIETRVIYDKEVHFVAGNSLVACFDENVDEGLIKEIAKGKPLKVVFRDSSFASCPDRINLEEIFKSISPGTEIKVL